jgi:hypothetical protein
MTWFKVDDSFHTHPKLAELEAGPRFAEAIALWTIAGSWCAHHLTNGRVPAAALRKLVPFPAARAAAELVRVGLWVEADGGYAFHAWCDYQPTKERVEAERAASAGRLAKWRKKNAATPAVTPTETPPATPPVTPFQTLPPTRPDPTRSVLRTQGVCAGEPTGLRALMRSGYGRRYQQATGREPSGKAISHHEWDAICAEIVKRLPDSTAEEASATVLGAFFRCPRAKRLAFAVGQIGTSIDAYAAGQSAEPDAKAANDNTPRAGRIVY